MSRTVFNCIAIAATLACCGCASRVTRSTCTESSDSLLATQTRTEARQEATRTERKDSTAHERADSVYIYDSTHVTEHADGSVEVYRFRDRYHGRTLTEARNSRVEHADSFSTSSCDTLAIKETSTRSTERSKTAQPRHTIFYHAMLFAALVIVLAGTYIIIRRKV